MDKKTVLKFERDLKSNEEDQVIALITALGMDSVKIDCNGVEKTLYVRQVDSEGREKLSE